MAGKISSKIKAKASDNTVGVIVAIVVVLVLLLIVVISIQVSSKDRDRNLGVKEVSLEQKEQDILENSADTAVTLYVERGVTADERHYSIEMKISANARTITIFRGYQNTEQRQEILANNTEAYEAFLKALNVNNFLEAREEKSGLRFREACPTSRNYRFKMSDGSEQKFDRWYTFCNSNRHGDYGGKVNAVFSLFRNQFPEYSTYTRGIRF